MGRHIKKIKYGNGMARIGFLSLNTHQLKGEEK
jgi:hypothetical protein